MVTCKKKQIPFFKKRIQSLSLTCTHIHTERNKKEKNNKSKKKKHSPGWVAQLTGASFCAPKCCVYDSPSGHIPRLQVRSLVRVHTGGNRSMFLSLFLSVSHSPYLPSLKSMNMSSGENLKKKEERKEKHWRQMHLRSNLAQKLVLESDQASLSFN